MEIHDPNAITYFAQTNFRGEARRFGIKRDDRRRHMYVIGKTGMGKSTMLENMIIQDIANGEGVAVVDPHGDLVEKVIDYIPEHRLKDVVYFNPADLHFPIAFNIVEQVDDEYKNLIANGLVGVFKKIWADSWGPRLEYILINTILSLLDYPGATLLGVTRMLVDPAYRKKVMKKIKDPIVLSFWVNEYNNYSEKFRNEAIAPIQNKVGQFLSSALIRNIVGQEVSRIDMRKEMDNGKILLMNLSKGRIGEENAALLGAMMITRIQLAAMSRVDIPEHERRDFFLYVDEFQNFSTESFASILSEARKYRLNIIMAHQYIEQLSDEVRAAVFGNVGSMVAFRVGATDAEELEKEFQPTFMQEDIVKLPSFHIYLRLMIDGVASDPFSATTLPPISEPFGLREEIIEFSRGAYASDRSEVEHSIQMWAAVDDNQVKSLQEKHEKKMERQKAESEKKDGEEAKDAKDLLPVRSKNGIPLPPNGLDVAPNVQDDVVSVHQFLDDSFDDPAVDTSNIQDQIEDYMVDVDPLEHDIDFFTAFTQTEEREKLQHGASLVPESPQDIDFEMTNTKASASDRDPLQDDAVEEFDIQNETFEALQDERLQDEEGVKAMDVNRANDSFDTRNERQESQTNDPRDHRGGRQQRENENIDDNGSQKTKRKRKRKRKRKSDSAGDGQSAEKGSQNSSQQQPSTAQGNTQSTHQPFRAALEQLAKNEGPQRSQGSYPHEEQKQNRQEQRQYTQEREQQVKQNRSSQHQPQPVRNAPRQQHHHQQPTPIQPGQHVVFD